MHDEHNGIEVNGTTGPTWSGTPEFDEAPGQLDTVYVDPLHGVWPIRFAPAPVTDGVLDLEVPAIKPDQADARGPVCGKPASKSGVIAQALQAGAEAKLQA